MRNMAFDPPGEMRTVPAIIVGNRDLRSLRALVERHVGGPDRHLADQLDAELQRAIVVPQAQVPAEIVGIGSRVVFEDLDTTLRREVELALPGEGSGSRRHLSVLSPLGVALLGAAAGETVAYAAPSSWGGEVRILSVTRGGDGS